MILLSCLWLDLPGAVLDAQEGTRCSMVSGSRTTTIGDRGGPLRGCQRDLSS